MWVTKGTKVRFRFLKANPPGDYSIAGCQMKLTADEISGEGIVRGVWSDKPPGEGGRVRFDVEVDGGEIIQVPATGVYWAEDENGKGYKVEF